MNILLLNGWSIRESGWMTYFDSLPAFESVSIINIDRQASLDQWFKQVDAQVSGDTLLMGWSLGGMLAMDYASRTRKVFKGLICLMANPVFVQTQGWSHGWDRATFSDFECGIKSGDVRSTLTRFAFLATAGLPDQRRALRALLACNSGFSPVDRAVLGQSLALLASLDLRESLKRISLPALFVYGELDRVAPFNEDMSEMLSPNARIEVLAGVSHSPFGAAQESVLRSIEQQVARFG